MFLIKHSLHHQYSLWYFRVFWLRHQLTLDRLRHWALISSAGLIVIIGLQLAYPRNLALPRTRISGASFGLRSQASIEQKLTELSASNITVVTPQAQHVMQPQNLGIAINTNATAKKATSYTIRERLIPFSWVFTRKDVNRYEITTDDQKLQAVSEMLTLQNKPAVDATIKVTGPTVVSVPSEQGFIYEIADSKAQLEAATLTSDMKVNVAPKVIEPAIETAVADRTSAEVNQRLQTPLEIDAVTSKIAVNAETMASWLIIKQDPANKTLGVEFDREKVKATLMSLSSKVYIAETPNRITLIDGEAVGSDQGLAGQALLLEDSISEVIGAANSGKTSASIKLQAITPNTQIVRTYTKTSKGLQALINYWVQTHGGQFGISLRTTNGSIVAAYNGDKQFTSASIYKIYVAYVVYNEVTNGTMLLDTTTSTGASVAACMEKMIVWSDNGCAIALGNMIGWESNNALLQAKGFGSTNLQSGAHLTTANDSATFLMSLANNNLLRADLNSALVQLMSRQKYRMGIPAGSTGSAVANKIGDAGTYQHDVAIVYHPKGAYVLSIFSSGSSIWTFSSLAKQISDVMNQ